MKKILFTLALLVSFSSFGQDDINSKDALKLCSVLQLNNFGTDSDAEKALDKILNVIGASKRFVLQPCSNIDNAVATAYKGIRYILYDREFMNSINYGNNWGNIFILAHEVGHHINGHTLDLVLYTANAVESVSLSQSRQQELEADEFAGFVLAKLGGSLSAAKQSISSISSNRDDTYSTHPSRDKRLAAVNEGFNKAKTNQPNINYLPSETKSNYVEITDDIKFRYIRKGNGVRVYNKMISFHSIVKKANGEILYSSYPTNNPVIVELGTGGQIIVGLEMVLQLLRVGDIVKIILLPKHTHSKETQILEIEINSVE